MSANKKLTILILALSAVTHFAFFGHPNQTVFDEVHFGKFISGYFTGEYFFDIHPPLGKLLISGMGYLTGFQPGFSFANIGETFPNEQYLWLRLLPSLAGLLLPLVIFLLARELNFSSRASLLAGLLVIFENALTVQSRFILLDSFLLLFGFSALLFYFKYRRLKVEPLSDQGSTLEWRWLILTGLSAGLAASVKWTGLAFLGIILILELIRLGKSAIKGSTNFLGLILIPIAIYASIFALHFSLLPKPGPGDPFMSPEFKTGTLSLAGKFVELNKQMYSANQRVTASHPYSSKWHDWPFLVRSVFFWQKTSQHEKIYLLGNPFVWWAGTIAVILLLASSVKKLSFRTVPHFTENFLLFGFLANLLPFIGIRRVMFLYHYFPALIFSFLALAYLTDKANKKSTFAFLVTIAIIGFLFFSPLTYGLSLSPVQERYLFWFSGWR